MEGSPFTSVRVYRDDNSLYQESEYIAIVDNKYAYLVFLHSVRLPEWKQAIIELLKPIVCPAPELFNNTGSARGGWHYLLNTEDIQEIRGQEVLAQRIPGENAFVIEEEPANLLDETSMYSADYTRYRQAMDERWRRATGIFDNIEQQLPLEYGFMVAILARRFSSEQMAEALQHLQAGEEVFFKYHEWGEE